MLAFVRSFARNRRLLGGLVSRDLRARYVGSSMGFFWSVLFPIINLFVYMFVFRLVLKMRWSDQQGTSEVALLMLAGILVWSAFAEGISRTTNTLVDNQNLIQKVVFPSEVLPAYLTASSLINMMIGLVVALGGVAFFAYVRPERAAGAEAQPIVLWAEHAGETPVEGNGVVRPSQFRCASDPAATDYDGLVVLDRADEPWRGAVEGLGAGDVQRVVKGDLVYADGGRWGMIRLRDGATLSVDAWRDAQGRPVEAPADGARAVVVTPPSRPLALNGWLVCLVPLIALQGVFMLGLGYLLAAFNLFLRDTFHLIGVLLTVWMFATPIFYPAHMVVDAGFGWVLEVNPMYWLIDGYREVMIYGSPPDWGTLGQFALVSALLLFLGSTFFLAQKPRFPDLL